MGKSRTEGSNPLTRKSRQGGGATEKYETLNSETQRIVGLAVSLAAFKFVNYISQNANVASQFRCRE